MRGRVEPAVDDAVEVIGLRGDFYVVFGGFPPCVAAACLQPCPVGLIEGFVDIGVDGFYLRPYLILLFCAVLRVVAEVVGDLLCDGVVFGFFAVLFA